MNPSRLLRSILPPLIVFVVVHVAWQLIVRALDVPPWKVPAPTDIWKVSIERHADLLGAMLHTSVAAICGFVASAVVGILAGIILSSTQWMERAFYPFAVFLQTVPLVAIAPLLVLWVGPGLLAVTVSALIVGLFPVIVNTLAGIRGIEPGLRDLFRLYGASSIATLVKLKIPWATPNIVTGLRIASGLSVIGAVVGEFVAGSFEQQGLGLLVLSASRNLQTPLLFAAVALASLLGLGLFVMVSCVGHFLLRHWHASARD